MTLNEETKLLIARALDNWDLIQDKCFYDPTRPHAMETPIGEMYWKNPNLLWVYLTENEEGWDGSQTQLGLNKDGKIMWEYQSHCSCDGYEESHEHGTEFIPEVKHYELNQIPEDWEAKVRENIKKLLEAIK